MDATIAAGLIGAGSAILSSLLAGVFTLAATKRAMAQTELLKKYIRALEDIAALRDLEERYLDELARVAGETPDATKRRLWAAHEKAGGHKPSESAEPARVARTLESLR